jgi:hypothetical protein
MRKSDNRLLNRRALGVEKIRPARYARDNPVTVVFQWLPFAGCAVRPSKVNTRGIPRLVQNVALAAMLAALEAGKKTIDAATVQQAVVDLEAV